MTSYIPVLILGAPRSGTNMLRDVMTKLPGIATWPCDEINYIWRHGNLRYPSDEFTVDMARPGTIRYIRKQFEWVAKKYDAHTVVEKTCANSVRVDFVDQVMPEAKYIFIRRDGFDAVGSAIKRWTAEIDLSYLARKARFVPAADLPYYSFRYLLNRIYRILSDQKRLAFWGPKLDGMEAMLRKYSLEEVCAIQWKKCVEDTVMSLSKMTPDRWIEVCYEKFVTEPEMSLKGILDFLNIQASTESIAKAIEGVSPLSIGKGRKHLGETIDRLLPLIEKTLRIYGYN